MELKLYSPLMALEHEMQTIFDRAFGRLEAELPLHPSTDVTQAEGKLTVEMELPGLDAGEVDIRVENDMLVISGEKQRSHEMTEEHRYMKERVFGSFERRIMLPDGFDIDGIEALFDSGVLTVEVPVPESTEAHPRRIPVTGSH